ncbi:MAG: hypothetical protein IJR70_05960 [Eubacterium sp.]|nr:hypothetical protein [Eubacterium sp.]
MGYIPKTTKQPVKVFMGISAIRLALGIIVVFTVNLALSNISESVLLQVVGSIIALILYLILSGKSPSNPNKLLFVSMIDFFIFFLTPKKMYGNRTEEYKRYCEREEQKNGKKAKGRKEQQQEE